MLSMFAPEGELMQGELYSAIKNEEQQTGSDSSTTFSGEMHFYELVEDTKDGIWLVQVSVDLQGPWQHSKTAGHSLCEAKASAQCRSKREKLSFTGVARPQHWGRYSIASLTLLLRYFSSLGLGLLV